MTKVLHIISAVPQDLSFAWETEAFLSNLRDQLLSKNTTIVVGCHKGTERYQSYWDKLQERYSEVEFKFYSTENMRRIVTVYSPVIRPHILKEYFKENPQLKDECIFYCDTDILLTRPFPFYDFVSDDINYLSKTNYISASYFENKVAEAVPSRKSSLWQLDPLAQACKLVGLDKQIVIDNEENTGGCQYLLKNIDYKFWEDVETDCVRLRMYFQGINQDYFISEDKGYQSWAIGDMCAVLWNLWKRGAKTITPEVMDFNWATTPFQEWDKNIIYHNAGVTDLYLDKEKTIKMFNKADSIFRSCLRTPFDIDRYENISKDYCGFKYLEYLQSIKDPICITKNNELVY